MKRTTEASVSRDVRAAANHLGRLIRAGRLARKMTRAELSTRARVSPATLQRVEEGSPTTAFGAVASIMEQLGMLPLLLNLRDVATEDLLMENGPVRGRTKSTRRNMDF